MAGDWIKMRPSLLTSPKVNGMARFLEDSTEVSRALSTGYSGPMSEIVTRNVMRNVTVSSLLIVWSAANEHTNDGVFKNADLSDIDDMVGIPRFGDAMEFVGWAIFDAENGCVILPNFNEYNTCGKDRAAENNAERQRRFREKKRDVTSTSNEKNNVTNNVTSNDREEKRREEENKPLEAAHAEDISPAKSKPAVSAKEMVESLPGLSVTVAADFIAHRKAKRCSLTASAWKAIVSEVEASKWSPDAALSEAMAAGWQGVKADWLANRKSTFSARPAGDPFAGCE